MYNKKKIKVSDGGTGERSLSMDLTNNGDLASSFGITVFPAGLDEKSAEVVNGFTGSASPDSADMFVMESVKDIGQPHAVSAIYGSGDANDELDAMCEKSWQTRTDAKYELECKYKEYSNKPIGEDIKYRGGKQLRLICNGCDSFCVTVRMKRLRVAGEESISKFFVIKDKSSLLHENCDPSKIKYEMTAPNEDGTNLSVPLKRRISTATHRTSFTGSKKEEQAQDAIAASDHVLKTLIANDRKEGGFPPDSGSDTSDDEYEPNQVVMKAPTASTPVKNISKPVKKANKGEGFAELPGNDLAADPLSGIPNKFWSSRSEAKTELEHTFGSLLNKCLGEDTKYRGGKQLKLICHGCKNFCIVARMKRLRIPNSREKVSRFFVIKPKSHLEHYSTVDGERVECDGSMNPNRHHAIGSPAGMTPVGYAMESATGESSDNSDVDM